MKILNDINQLGSIYASLFHNIEELLLVDFSISILVELVDHGLQFIIAEVFAQFSGDSSQVSETNSAAVILIEQLEGFEDFLDGISWTDLLSHYFKKIRVFYLSTALSVVFLHQIKHFLLLHIKAQGSHRYFQFMIINGSCFVRVKQIKGLLNLLFLLLWQLLSLLSFDLSCYFLLLVSQKVWLS